MRARYISYELFIIVFMLLYAFRRSLPLLETLSRVNLRSFSIMRRFAFDSKSR